MVKTAYPIALNVLKSKPRVKVGVIHELTLLVTITYLLLIPIDRDRIISRPYHQEPSVRSTLPDAKL
jgi:hypothetical protein